MKFKVNIIIEKTDLKNHKCHIALKPRSVTFSNNNRDNLFEMSAFYSIKLDTQTYSSSLGHLIFSF